MYKYTNDGCVVDGDGFIVAEFPYKEDALRCAREANRQVREGEREQDVECRLRDWAHDLALEDDADDEAAVRYAD